MMRLMIISDPMATRDCELMYCYIFMFTFKIYNFYKLNLLTYTLLFVGVLIDIALGKNLTFKISR